MMKPQDTHTDNNDEFVLDMTVNEKSWHSKISEFSHRISHHITTKVYSLNVIVTENKQACLQTSCNNLKLYLSRSREVSLQIHDWMRLAYHFNAETTLQAMQWRYATSCHWSHSAIQPHSGSRVMAAVFLQQCGCSCNRLHDQRQDKSQLFMDFLDYSA